MRCSICNPCWCPTCRKHEERRARERDSEYALKLEVERLEKFQRRMPDTITARAKLRRALKAMLDGLEAQDEAATR